MSSVSARRNLLEILLPVTPPPVGLGLLLAAVLIVAETLVLFAIDGSSPGGARGALYLVGVLVVASVWGRVPGIATAAVSTVAFNYFHVAPTGRLSLTPEGDLQELAAFMVTALLVSGLADLARSRTVEALRREAESDLAAELARLALSSEDLRSALEVTAQRLARWFDLPRASIDLDDTAGDDRDVALPLCDGPTCLGTLRIPADTPAAVLERIRDRLVPPLAAVLRTARDRQTIISSLRASQQESASLLAEQAALRRVATLVACGTAPAEVFAAVAAELHRLFAGFSTALIRYETDGTVTSVAGLDESGSARLPVANAPIDGDNVSSAILRTGNASRIDSYETATGPIAEYMRRMGIRSGVGVPVLVEGSIWGVALVMSSKADPIPADAEERLRAFTELIATAIANADSRAQLVASRARVVTAADEARRRIERDLHDGAQQRIVSLALELRMAAESVPAEQSAVRQLLSHSVQGLTEVHEGLRDLARGIHPVQLSQGGICPVLRTLARRSTVPVELDLHIGRSLPERVEVAVYFVVSEALTNAAKHSQASVVHVTVETDTSAIRLSVHDDGTGGADVSEGTGLMGLRDRVEALGGRLNIVSPPGQGTTLTAEIPIDDVDMADLVPPGAERRRKSV
ncbi:hypothetical protein GCM10010399_54270 [Dactylosporangium fulvum]|uniref:histidine kinase n=2 Tax=Dactylosporangium fulvum TaxID=53359 RepID=A0ABY5WBG8_9ACTN|nr:DUF4118 domain-containing protein [Dactylosporangium fulvum]UWP87212.1 DUF4118 domain-containing protein [Dactylosporangium fulvum]